MLEALFSITWQEPAHRKTVWGRDQAHLRGRRGLYGRGNGEIGPCGASRDAYHRTAFGLASQRFRACPLSPLAEKRTGRAECNFPRHLSPKDGGGKLTGGVQAELYWLNEAREAGCSWCDLEIETLRELPGKTLSELGLPPHILLSLHDFQRLPPRLTVYAFGCSFLQPML